MNLICKVKINIWERDFELNVEYDCYPGEEILPAQKEAIEKFLDLSTIKESREKVEKYCLENNGEEIGTDKIINIFKYVMPKYLFVKRNEKKHIVAIMCNYKFDNDNGIAVVFENEKFVAVGDQDIIL